MAPKTEHSDGKTPQYALGYNLSFFFSDLSSASAGKMDCSFDKIY